MDNSNQQNQNNGFEQPMAQSSPEGNQFQTPQQPIQPQVQYQQPGFQQPSAPQFQNNGYQQAYQQPYQQMPQEQKTNGLAIAGLILAFLFPLIGLILSIVGFFQAKSKNEKGKGLAIAGIIISIVIMLLGILIIVLMISTVSNVQTKARDVERTLDIKVIHGQVEAYYAKNGYYPSLADLNSTSFRTAYMPGLTSEALKDPASLGQSGQLYSSPQLNAYSYAAKTSSGLSCDNITTSTRCMSYTLTAKLDDGTTFTKTNLN